MNYETSEQYKMWKPGNSVMGGFFILMGTIFFLGMSEVTILGSVANNSTHLKVDRGSQIEALGLDG